MSAGRLKIVLVTAAHHPLHAKWLEVAKRLAEKLNAELEVREEDYMFVNQYGDKDEYGMAWLPQLFAVTADGKVKLLLSRMPLTPDHKPDIEQALREALARLEAEA